MAHRNKDLFPLFVSLSLLFFSPSVLCCSQGLISILKRYRQGWLLSMSTGGVLVLKMLCGWFWYNIKLCFVLFNVSKNSNKFSFFAKMVTKYIT